MIDKREAILARLRDIAASVPGLAQFTDLTVRGVGRNRDELNFNARPAIIQHDGTEDLVPKDNGPRRSAVQYISMNPAIVILVGSSSDNVGALANSFRAALIPLVLQDDELIALTGGEFGEMRYTGCIFEATAGEKREARLTINFTFQYIFRLSDLTAP